MTFRMVLPRRFEQGKNAAIMFESLEVKKFHKSLTFFGDKSRSLSRLSLRQSKQKINENYEKSISDQHPCFHGGVGRLVWLCLQFGAKFHPIDDHGIGSGEPAASATSAQAQKTKRPD